MRCVVASVPGKLILMGEHAAVYGRPALVAAVGLRATVKATVDAAASGDAGVILDLPGLGVRAGAGWPELAAYALRARAAWQRYAERPSAERFRAVSSGDPAHLVRIALGEAAGEVGSDRLPPLALEIRSDLPVGSGFGSSAAVAVGILAACLTALGAEPDVSTLDRLALEVERRQHGTPSGVDHNTVLRGGVLKVTREPRGGLAVEPVEVAAATLERFTVVHTGTPAQSTGEVVATVRDRRDRDPASFERLLDRMAADVVSFARSLSEESPDWRHLAELMEDYESCLEEIGVVPPSVRRAIELARQEGVAAKVSGAGGLSDAGAGSLLVMTDGSGGLPAAFAPYTAYPVRLGAPGLELEVLPT